MYTFLNLTGAQSDYFGQGSGSIWLDNVACSGSESNLLSCPHAGLGNTNCLHQEDIGVRCQGTNDNKLSQPNYN